MAKEKTADFIRIVSFGKTAELCERYLAKGRLVAVQGRIQTGQYKDKNGETRYTTDVVADRVQFLEWGDKNERSEKIDGGDFNQPSLAPGGFTELDDDDIPF
jgi:single-strand DNA-binding protein